jgi:hypothetical protein
MQKVTDPSQSEFRIELEPRLLRGVSLENIEQIVNLSRLLDAVVFAVMTRKPGINVQLQSDNEDES